MTSVLLTIVLRRHPFSLVMLATGRVHSGVKLEGSIGTPVGSTGQKKIHISYRLILGGWG